MNWKHFLFRDSMRGVVLLYTWKDRTAALYHTSSLLIWIFNLNCFCRFNMIMRERRPHCWKGPSSRRVRSHHGGMCSQRGEPASPHWEDLSICKNCSHFASSSQWKHQEMVPFTMKSMNGLYPSLYYNLPHWGMLISEYPPVPMPPNAPSY